MSIDLETFREKYYSELHAAARHYDSHAWLALAAFFLLISWVATYTWDGNLFTLNHLPIFFSIGLASSFLLLRYIKVHATLNWIQYKINYIDKAMNDLSGEAPLSLSRFQPLYYIGYKDVEDNMGASTVEDILQSLKTHSGKETYFNTIWMQEKLLFIPTSRLFMWFMGLTALTGYVLAVITIIKIFGQ